MSTEIKIFDGKKKKHHRAHKKSIFQTSKFWPTKKFETSRPQTNNLIYLRVLNQVFKFFRWLICHCDPTVTGLIDSVECFSLESRNMSGVKILSWWLRMRKQEVEMQRQARDTSLNLTYNGTKILGQNTFSSRGYTIAILITCKTKV